MLFPLKLPPGVYRNGTNYQSLGRWYDANLVRWFEGTIRPIGGWRKVTTSAFSGIARGMFAWRDNVFNRWCAVGTASKLYAYTGGSLYDITPAGFTAGRVDSFSGIGYGYGPYSTGLYGAAPIVSSVIDATTWTFDNWGQYLIAVSNFDGKIYQWQLATATPAAVVTNAPTSCAAAIVTPERYLIALGAGGDPRRISWSTQEDNTVWTATATNTAGGLNLVSNGRIRCARRVRGQIVIFTDTEIHSLNYLGPPFIYGTEIAGRFCGIIGPNAVAVIESGAVWMSNGSFFRYNGTLEQIPCEISDYLFGDFNIIQAAKVYCGINNKFGELWWYYCSAASSEIDRYVVWNHRENHWTIGILARTSWADSGVFPYPMAAGSDGFLYEHENGWTDNGTPLLTTRYLKSGPVAIGDGDKVITVNQIIPDEVTPGQVQFQVATKFTPEGSSTSYGPYTIAAYTDVRFTGRQAALEVDSLSDSDWRVGVIRMDGIQGGKR